ncbi:MAG: hypothetical protein IKU41_03050 [Clostridia bacterium]|nr:hypothetical protein [Clostridia bacterium]
MKKSEFKKMVKEYIKNTYGYLDYKHLYIEVEEWSLGYLATCVIIVNTAIVYKLFVDSDYDKTMIQKTELKVSYL